MHVQAIDAEVRGIRETGVVAKGICDKARKENRE